MVGECGEERVDEHGGVRYVDVQVGCDPGQSEVWNVPTVGNTHTNAVKRGIPLHHLYGHTKRGIPLHHSYGHTKRGIPLHHLYGQTCIQQYINHFVHGHNRTA